MTLHKIVDISNLQNQPSRDVRAEFGPFRCAEGLLKLGKSLFSQAGFFCRVFLHLAVGADVKYVRLQEPPCDSIASGTPEHLSHKPILWAGPGLSQVLPVLGVI